MDKKHQARYSLGMTSHIPVLLHEMLALFQDKPLHTFLDVTLGAGGHALALLDSHPELAHFYGSDRDPFARELAKQRLMPHQNRVHVIASAFGDLAEQVPPLPQCDGIWADLGVSSIQLDTAERGFSFRMEGPLDMRMDPTSPLTAADIINTWSEPELAKIFFRYGEEPYSLSRVLAKVIGKARKLKEIVTTSALVELLKPHFPFSKTRTIHPCTRVFQALRIAVNQELAEIERFLPWAISQLLPGGRLAVISFHSLEDRLVKQAFAYAASDKESTIGRGGVFLDKTPSVRLLTTKPLSCSDEEAAINPRARSAKLRAVEKI